MVVGTGAESALGQLRDEELVRVLDDLLHRVRRLLWSDQAAAAKVEKAAALLATLVAEAVPEGAS